MASTSHLELMDYVILAAVFALSLLIGLVFAWRDRNKTTNEFLMAGKSMASFPVMISLVASFLSSIHIIGWPAEVYYNGVQIWITFLVCFLEVYFTAEIVLPIFYRLNLTSVNKYIEERFGSEKIRVIISVVSCIAVFPWLGVVLYGPSLALGGVTGFSVNTSVLICGLICTLYTAMGGLKAVIWTDVLQYSIMLIGVIVVIFMGTYEIGGLSEVWNRAELGGRLRFLDHHFDPYNSYNQWTLFLGTLCIWTAGLSTSQAFIQRTLTMPTLGKAKKVIYLALPGFLGMDVLVTILGVVVYAYFYRCDPLKSKKIEATDQIVPYFVVQLFGNRFPGALGLFVSCVFCGTLSTLSSIFNSIAALIWDDWLKKFFPNSSNLVQVTITKSLAAMAGIACIGVAFLASRAGTLLEASYSLSGSPLGPTFAVFILGMFAPFANAKGAMTGYLVGQVVCVWIVTGGLINMRPSRRLEVSLEGCAANMTLGAGLPLAALNSYVVPPYEPVSFNKLYHLSHFLIPFIGFGVSLVTGLIASLLFGGNRDRCVNPDLLVPWVHKWCHVSGHRRNKNGKIVKKCSCRFGQTAAEEILLKQSEM